MRKWMLNLVALFVVLVCLSLLFAPAYLIRLSDRALLSNVQTAEGTYYVGDIASYAGEETLYRRLLLLSGVWESKREEVFAFDMEKDRIVKGKDELPASLISRLDTINSSYDLSKMFDLFVSSPIYLTGIIAQPAYFAVWKNQDVMLDKYAAQIIEVVPSSDMSLSIQGDTEKVFDVVPSFDQTSYQGMGGQPKPVVTLQPTDGEKNWQFTNPFVEKAAAYYDYQDGTWLGMQLVLSKEGIKKGITFGESEDFSSEVFPLIVQELYGRKDKQLFFGLDSVVIEADRGLPYMEYQGLLSLKERQDLKPSMFLDFPYDPSSAYVARLTDVQSGEEFFFILQLKPDSYFFCLAPNLESLKEE